MLKQTGKAVSICATAATPLSSPLPYAPLPTLQESILTTDIPNTAMVADEIIHGKLNETHSSHSTHYSQSLKSSHSSHTSHSISAARHDRVEYKCIPSPLWASGFSFSDSSLLVEIPYDPRLPHLFFGEEISMAAR